MAKKKPERLTFVKTISSSVYRFDIYVTSPGDVQVPAHHWRCTDTRDLDGYFRSTAAGNYDGEPPYEARWLFDGGAYIAIKHGYYAPEANALGEVAL